MPTTVADLEKSAGIRLVIGDQKDPEDVGFVQWRSVFYVAGDVNNFLLLLDAFFVWTEKSIAQSQPFQVEIHPYIDSAEAGHVWDCRRTIISTCTIICRYAFAYVPHLYSCIHLGQC